MLLGLWVLSCHFFLAGTYYEQNMLYYCHSNLVIYQYYNDINSILM